MLDLAEETIRRGYRWRAHKTKILRVNPEILGMLCLQSESYKVTSGLPEDARCLAAHIDIRSGDILLKIESEEYEPVEQGAMVPELNAKILMIERIQSRKDVDSLLCDMLKRPQGE
jgi:hypothetical protein